VGEGAMASVWSAVHETLGRPVAVKFIHARGQNAEVTAARFMQEARIAAAVQHRFVVDIFDFGQTEHAEPYMVMELLQGESLADRITRGPPIPVKTFVRIMGQALSGLDAVHQAGIVHRDLKPENVYLMHDADGGFPKLLDFGISRVDESLSGEKATRLTKEGTLLGTPWYMSPEQVRGREVDGRSDIYSMAVIMYETLTGQLPFDAEAVGDLLVKIATADATPVSALRPDLPTGLSDIVAKAMSREPDGRYDSALSMRLALQALDGRLPDAFTVVIARADSEPPLALGSADIQASASSSGSHLRTPGQLAPGSETLDEADPAIAAMQSKGSAVPWIAAAAVALLIGGGVAAFAGGVDGGSEGEAATGPTGDLRSAPLHATREPAPVEAPDAGVAAAGDEARALRTAEIEDETPRGETKRERRAARRRAAQRGSADRQAGSAMEARPAEMSSTPESFRDPGF